MTPTGSGNPGPLIATVVSDSAETDANAALIVALHNCAGELLDVAEAAEEVVKIWQDPRCNHVPDGAIALLEDSLRALKEGKT